MIQPVRKPQTPSFSTVLPGSRKYGDLVRDVDAIAKYLKLFTGTYLDQLMSQIVQQVNTQVQGVGPVLPSAPLLIPTAAIHHVSGVAAIDTINAPSAFSGPLFLIPDGAWTLVLGGNIGKATTAVVGQVMMVVFDYTLWYPSY